MQLSSFISNFRKIVIIALFAYLIFQANIRIGERYAYAAAQNRINVWSQQRFDDFYNMPPNTLDLIFLGSSHSYCTFDPEKIDEVMGTNSFQLGMPLQHPDASYFTFREVLRTQSPDTVVVTLSWSLLQDDFSMQQIDHLFPVLDGRGEGLRNDILENMFPLNQRVKFNIAPIRFQHAFFAYTNNRLMTYFREEHDLRIILDFGEGREYYRSRGYIFASYIMTPAEYERIENSPPRNVRNWRPSPVQVNYVERIAQLAYDEGISLVFVTAPVSNVYLATYINYEAIHNQVRNLAERLDVPYLDFNMLNIDGQMFLDEHFRDARHLNDNGAQIAGNFFAAWYRAQTR
ncbi:MAG: hypothetical protein FWE24_00450 [Defluviitaleaceae bacterium]|nr:hypothetical protein [Defluviitaleaceae bacterium]